MRLARQDPDAIDNRLGAKIKYSSFPAIVKELTHEGRQPGSYTWPVKNPRRRIQVEAQRDKSLAVR